MPLFFFDTETTGLPLKRSRWGLPSYKDLDAYRDVHLCSIAWIIEREDGTTESEYHLLKPDIYHINNSEFHGITHEMAEEQGISYSSLISRLESLFMEKGPWSFVGHNVNFDRNVLANAILRRGNQHFAEFVGKRHSVCTMNLAKKVMHMEKYPKLIELYKRLFDGKEFTGQHNARDDIQATFECFQKLKPLMKECS